MISVKNHQIIYAFENVKYLLGFKNTLSTNVASKIAQHRPQDNWYRIELKYTNFRCGSGELKVESEIGNQKINIKNGRRAEKVNIKKSAGKEWFFFLLQVELILYETKTWEYWEKRFSL